MFTAPFGIVLILGCLAMVVGGIATAWKRLQQLKRRRG